MGEQIWKFETARFTVILECDFEDYPDISWDETGEVREKLESGEWGNYCFAVRVLCDDNEIATDYLGNSIYADPREFYIEHLGIRAQARASGMNIGCYFTDMVSRAIAEARKRLCNVPKLRCA